MRTNKIIGILLCSFMVGCGMPSIIEGDVYEILNRYKVEYKNLKANMLEGTETGVAELWVEQNQIDKLIKGLELIELTPEKRASDLKFKRLKSEIKAISSSLLKDDPNILIYKSSSLKPKLLQLQSGGRFAYLVLYYDPGTRRGLFQVSYGKK